MPQGEPGQTRRSGKLAIKPGFGCGNERDRIPCRQQVPARELPVLPIDPGMQIGRFEIEVNPGPSAGGGKTGFATEIAEGTEKSRARRDLAPRPAHRQGLGYCTWFIAGIGQINCCR